MQKHSFIQAKREKTISRDLALRLFVYDFVHLRFCPPASASVARSKLNAFSACDSVVRTLWHSKITEGSMNECVNVLLY